MWFGHVQDGLGYTKKKINIVIILINSEITYYLFIVKYIYPFFFFTLDYFSFINVYNLSNKNNF